MKKSLATICFLILSSIILSCSDNDTTSPTPVPLDSTVTFKVDGVQKSFTNVAVTESVYTFEDQSIPSYSILATTDDDGEFVAIQVRRDYTGAEGLYQFIYDDGNTDYNLAENFVMNITTNEEGNLVGIFSGLLQLSGTETGVTITEGTFNINF